MSHRVVVIGAGAIGTACAHYLSKAGCEVTLLDKEKQGRGATCGNCGNLGYSHVLPLSEPGVVMKTLKAMTRGDSPLYIKPRIDPALWSWLLHFAMRCNKKDMLQSTHALYPLMQSSKSLYEELMTEASLDCEWDDSGNIYVYETEKALEEYAETNRMLTEELGLKAERIEAEALVKMEPSIRPGTSAGAWIYKDDIQVRPETMMSSWRELIESNGVTIKEHCAAKSIVRNNGVASAVITESGELPADAVVVATGAWTPLLNKELGCRIPVQPGKGYSITMPRPNRCPKHLLLFCEDSVVVTPMESGYRLGSTMEFSGYDDSLNQRRLAMLTNGAKKYLHEPFGPPEWEEWYGWRPMTYDNLPIIDRTPAMSNVYIATGHNMFGLTAATCTGKLIAEMVTGASPHVDLAPYSLSRF